MQEAATRSSKRQNDDDFTLKNDRSLKLITQTGSK